jgi:hypothetical protein
MVNNALDNLSCIFISFENFSKIVYNRFEPDIYNKMTQRISQINQFDFRTMRPEKNYKDRESIKVNKNNADFYENNVNNKFRFNTHIMTASNFNTLNTNNNFNQTANKPLFKINPKVTSYDNNTNRMTTQNGFIRNEFLPHIYKGDNIIKKDK